MHKCSLFEELTSAAFMHHADHMGLMHEALVSLNAALAHRLARAAFMHHDKGKNTLKHYTPIKRLH